MTSEIERLVEMLEDISTTLKSFDEKHWGDWIAGDATRLRRGDLTAIDHFLSAFGGMGSINDLYICPRNGHRVREAEVSTANDLVSRTLSAAWNLARTLAKER